MDKERIEQLLLLSELPGVGERILHRLLARAAQCGVEPIAVLRWPAAELRELGLPRGTVDFLQAHGLEHRQRCAWLAQQLAAHGGWVVTWLDSAFPARLRQRLEPPPPLLFAAGPAALLRQPSCALLHSREPTAHTLEAYRSLVGLLARYRLTLVTSAHKATYRMAATFARSESCDAVVVLDRGLFHVLGPHLNRDPLGGLAPERAGLGQSLVISSARLFDYGLARSGQRRDQIVAALADLVIAVHARPGGFIESLCLQTLAAGRPVLSWRGESAALLAAGARPATSESVEALIASLAAITPSGSQPLAPSPAGKD